MSQILKPMGQIVQRLSFEYDAKGMVWPKLERLVVESGKTVAGEFLLREVPLLQTECMMLLSQILATTLAQVHAGALEQMRRSNGGEKT